jgi:phage-related protein
MHGYVNRDQGGVARICASTIGRSRGLVAPGVLELIEDDAGGTYRAVYTVSYRARSMCCTFFKRNRNAANKRRSAILV